MSLMSVTAGSLSRDLNEEVPDIYVVIAKHSVLGMDAESIKDILGCTMADVQEVESNELYKQVRTLVGAAQAQARVDQTTGWDAIEDMAIKNLAARMPFEKDGDFLLRVAAVANKAVRRTQDPSNVLDPGKQNGRIAISLTQRFIEKVNALNNGTERVEERTLSIRDGSMRQPTFDDVDAYLQVSSHAIPRTVEITTQTAEPSFDELDDLMKSKGF